MKHSHRRAAGKTEGLSLDTFVLVEGWVQRGSAAGAAKVITMINTSRHLNPICVSDHRLAAGVTERQCGEVKAT